jgi:hypothetical protein
MLQFRQSDTTTSLILTLSELKTETSPDYHFVFTHILTRDTVSFTKLNGDDESLYPYRYNKFTIDPSTLFDGKEPGEWHYKVYENDADGTLLEQGKLMLQREEDFEYTTYNSSNSFTTYNG